LNFAARATSAGPKQFECHSSSRLVFDVFSGVVVEVLKKIVKILTPCEIFGATEESR